MRKVKDVNRGGESVGRWEWDAPGIQGGASGNSIVVEGSWCQQHYLGLVQERLIPSA